MFVQEVLQQPLTCMFVQGARLQLSPPVCLYRRFYNSLSPVCLYREPAFNYPLLYVCTGGSTTAFHLYVCTGSPPSTIPSCMFVQEVLQQPFTCMFVQGARLQLSPPVCLYRR